jgi:anti-sigma factor RsiW
MTPRGNNLGGPGSTLPGGLSGHIDEWDDFAVDYLDGRLSPDDKAAVEQHLVGCPSCASRMAAQQSVITFLQRTPQDEAPESMEDAVLGELLFPTRPGAQQAFRGRVLQSPPRSRWSRLRPWLPVTAAVAVVLMGVVAFGVLKPSPNNFVATKEATTTRIAESQDTAAGSSAPGATLTTTAAFVSTTAAGGSESTTTSGTNLSVASAPAAIRDRQEMIRALQSASGPAYVTFEAPAASESTTTAETGTTTTLVLVDGSAPVDSSSAATSETIPAAKVDDVISQIAAFTGLEQLSPDLSMGGPTFAAYVSRKQLTQFLDLLFSIKSSVTVDLALRMSPETDLAENADLITEHKAEVPVLSSHVVPQPAVIRYSFTTSTLVPAGGEATPPNMVTPDDEGTHVLIVIFVRR